MKGKSHYSWDLQLAEDKSWYWFSAVWDLYKQKIAVYDCMVWMKFPCKFWILFSSSVKRSLSSNSTGCPNRVSFSTLKFLLLNFTNSKFLHSGTHLHMLDTSSRFSCKVMFNLKCTIFLKCTLAIISNIKLFWKVI